MTVNFAQDGVHCRGDILYKHPTLNKVGPFCVWEFSQLF